MKIICDSREQLPYLFVNDDLYKGTKLETGTLATGDYSLVGLEDRVAVERKSLDDLMNCLGRDRERFMREMERGRRLESFCVVAECDWRAIAQGAYRSQIRPQSALATIHAIMSRMMIPVIFAGSRAGGEFSTFSFLKQFSYGLEKKAKDTLSLLGNADAMRPKQRLSRPNETRTETTQRASTACSERE